jgi:hypothetical protein
MDFMPFQHHAEAEALQCALNNISAEEQFELIQSAVTTVLSPHEEPMGRTFADELCSMGSPPARLPRFLAAPSPAWRCASL